MTWLIDVKANVVKSLAKIDRKQADRIWEFLEVELVNMNNPRSKGKALSGNLKGLWRYRVGDYRIICQIIDNEVVILVVELGHRKEIYRK
jgi:mRNA interferase RelE/StbE